MHVVQEQKRSKPFTSVLLFSFTSFGARKLSQCFNSTKHGPNTLVVEVQWSAESSEQGKADDDGSIPILP